MSAGKLPEGWVRSHLSEICSKPQYGYTTKSIPTGDVKFLRTTDITKGTVDWSSVPYCMDAPEDVSKYQLQNRDIVISRAGSVGFSFLVKKPPNQAVFASYLIRFKPSCYLSEHYLKRFLESSDYWEQLSLMSVGNAVQNVNARKLSTLMVPIPSIAEQKIIVEKLDTLLALVDSTKARLEQISRILKRFRQAVLTTAVCGALTKEWRENKKIHAPTPTPLDALINSIDQGWSPKCENYPADKHEWGVIKTTAVQPGYFISEENKKLPSSLAPKVNLSLKHDDVLITRAGPRSRCGIACIVNKDYPFLMICDKVYRVRVNQKKILSGFLNWCLNSPKYLDVIEKIKTGSSDSGMNLTQKKFLSFIINVPDILEQHEIVRSVEQLFAYADTIEKQVNNALIRVNNLTQSILAKAFRGELTAQWRAENPDLISGENSAAALLEKIKAERASRCRKNAP